MRRPYAACAIVFACCTLFPRTSSAQEARTNRRQGIVRPVIEGMAAGLGLAFAYVNPSGEGWLIDDGTAIPLALATGLGTAFAVRGASSRLDAAESRRPRLRVAGGAGGGMKWDYSLGYSAPIRERGQLGGMVLVSTDSWERIETQTRCDPFFGCFTGDFLTGYRYAQAIAALARGAFHLGPNTSSMTALVIGAGPMMTHVATHDRPASKHTGLLLDGGLAVELGSRSRWTVEAGVRVAVPSADAATGHYRGGWSLRVGRALGY
jgi:hypothetical protein